MQVHVLLSGISPQKSLPLFMGHFKLAVFYFVFNVTLCLKENFLIFAKPLTCFAVLSVAPAFITK